MAARSATQVSVVSRAGGSSSTTASALDRPIRAEDPNTPSAKVSFSAFAFLFSEMCNRANQVPTKVKTVVETEERLSAIGYQVGIRSLPLAALKEPLYFRQRPLTMDAALKLVTERLWVRWFGKAADVQKDTSSNRFFITDDEPVVVRHIHPTPDYIDTANNGAWFLTYASFVAGMIRGVLTTCQFPAQVSSYHQPEPDTPRAHWFVVEFDASVWDRARRQRT